ncbi:50S ribosomal protein L28 [Deltaproteobacteria bacterium TL4]
MSVKCDICNKSNQFGHNVSHSNRRTIKRWKPNLQSVNIPSIKGRKKKMKVCTQCIRSGRTLTIR